MQIFSVLKIGAFHTNYCEDFLIAEPLSSEKQLIAVMDGCTMGTESVFASTLYGKVLRKIARDMYYQDFIGNKVLSCKEQLRTVLRQLMEKLKSLQNQLGLDKNELLSTIVIGVLDTEKREAELMVVGDGLVYKDGVSYEFEQDNTPDYLGYHLSEDFDSWFEKQTQKITVVGFRDISIATDGIFTFQNVNKNPSSHKSLDVIDYLLCDLQYSEKKNLLERKIRNIEEDWGLTLTDDLAIVRIIDKI